MSRRNELEAQLREAPLDDATYLIYADLLLAEGDPRGELIMLDEAARRAPIEEHATWRRRRGKLLARHPELAPSVPDAVRLSWHLGFVRAVSFERIQEVEHLFAHPACAFVTTIDMQGIPTRVLEHAPPTVTRLVLGSGHRGTLDLDPLLARLPHLDEVSVKGDIQLTLHDRLRVLELVASRANLALFARMRFDRLERLVLGLGNRHPQAGNDMEPLSPSELAPLLDTPPPKLVHLAFLHPPDGDALIAALARSRVLPQLRTLRLWNAGLTLDGARAITREVFGHLEQLDLSDAGLGLATVKVVEHVCPDVRTIPLRFTAGSGS